MAVPEENVEGHADVSLITGDVRHLGVKDTGSTSSSAQAVVERGDNLQLANTASKNINLIRICINQALLLVKISLVSKYWKFCYFLVVIIGSLPSLKTTLSGG